MRTAVVGHVEWVEFARVEHVPRPGEIVHALDAWEEPAGGGGVAAVVLARLAGSCVLFTALGADALGRRAAERLVELRVELRVAWRDEPTRRAFTHLDADAERTITVIGARMVPSGADPLPWADLADANAVYLTGGDGAAVRAARGAEVLVATPRAADALAAAPDVSVDALVYSAADSSESAWAAQLATTAATPRYQVATRGAAGGTWTAADGATGAWAAAPLPGPIADAYGSGDTFAATLAFALGRGEPIAAAVETAAREGAACLTRRGPYG